MSDQNPTSLNPFAPPSTTAAVPSSSPAADAAPSSVGDVPAADAAPPEPAPPDAAPPDAAPALKVGQVVRYRYEDVYNDMAEVEVLGVVVDVDETGNAQLGVLERVTGHLPAAELEAL